MGANCHLPKSGNVPLIVDVAGRVLRYAVHLRRPTDLNKTGLAWDAQDRTTCPGLLLECLNLFYFVVVCNAQCIEPHLDDTERAQALLQLHYSFRSFRSRTIFDGSRGSNIPLTHIRR
jgi:hypothetical protein